MPRPTVSSRSLSSVRSESRPSPPQVCRFFVFRDVPSLHPFVAFSIMIRRRPRPTHFPGPYDLPLSTRIWRQHVTGPSDPALIIRSCPHHVTGPSEPALILTLHSSRPYPVRSCTHHKILPSSRHSPIRSCPSNNTPHIPSIYHPILPPPT